MNQNTQCEDPVQNKNNLGLKTKKPRLLLGRAERSIFRTHLAELGTREGLVQAVGENVCVEQAEFVGGPNAIRRVQRSLDRTPRRIKVMSKQADSAKANQRSRRKFVLRAQVSKAPRPLGRGKPNWNALRALEAKRL